MSIEEKEIIQQKLCYACYIDNVDLVKKLLEENSDIDLDAVHSSIGKCGIGTPLILTGIKEIGELLLNAGASINYVLSHNEFCNFTALDSINLTIKREESTLDIVRSCNGEAEAAKKLEKIKKYNEFRAFLISKGAKTYEELNNK